MLNILMTENVDDKHFIHTICIADMIPMMQSGKRKMLTVKTHGILDTYYEAVFFNVENVRSLVNMTL